MLTLKTTSQFRKDFKQARKRGLDLSLLETVLDTLMAGLPLDERFRDHELIGRYAGFRECHIQPDWLLIHAIDNDMLVLTATRTGSHSDLF